MRKTERAGDREDLFFLTRLPGASFTERSWNAVGLRVTMECSFIRKRQFQRTVRRRGWLPSVRLHTSFVVAVEEPMHRVVLHHQSTRIRGCDHGSHLHCPRVPRGGHPTHSLPLSPSSWRRELPGWAAKARRHDSRACCSCCFCCSCCSCCAVIGDGQRRSALQPVHVLRVDQTMVNHSALTPNRFWTSGIASTFTPKRSIAAFSCSRSELVPVRSYTELGSFSSAAVGCVGSSLLECTTAEWTRLLVAFILIDGRRAFPFGVLDDVRLLLRLFRCERHAGGDGRCNKPCSSRRRRDIRCLCDEGRRTPSTAAREAARFHLDVGRQSGGGRFRARRNGMGGRRPLRSPRRAHAPTLARAACCCCCCGL
jgi:hypothetical protein